MKIDEIVLFLQHLGVSEQSIQVDSSRGWVRSSCPFAPWLHSSGSDAKPSFGMTITDDNISDDNKQSIGYCFSCMSFMGGKSAGSLLQMFWYLSKEYPRLAARIAAGSGEDFDYNPVRGFNNLFDHDICINKLSPPKEDFNNVLKMFPRLSSYKHPEFRKLVENYLIYRGVTPAVQKLYDVRYGLHDGVIGFPMYTEDGNICHFRLRKPYTKFIRTLSASYFPKDSEFSAITFPPILDTGAFFGLHTIVKGLPIYVVEGEIDAMVWYSLGFPNVIASATTSVCASQFSRLFSLSSRIIFGFDADRAGDLITQKAALTSTRVGGSVFHIDWRKAGVKDAGELKTPEQVALVKKAIKPLTII